MEDTNQDEGHRKFPRICELLQIIHSKLQPYNKATKQVKEKERMGVERRTSTSIWETLGQNNKPTGTFSSKEKRKI